MIVPARPTGSEGARGEQYTSPLYSPRGNAWAANDIIFDSTRHLGTPGAEENTIPLYWARGSIWEGRKIQFHSTLQVEAQRGGKQNNLIHSTRHVAAPGGAIKK